MYCHYYVVHFLTDNTLQHAATCCNTVNTCRLTILLHPLFSLHTATHCNPLQPTATHCNPLQHAATHCNALHHTAYLYIWVNYTQVRSLFDQMHTSICWQDDLFVLSRTLVTKKKKIETAAQQRRHVLPQFRYLYFLTGKWDRTIREQGRIGFVGLTFWCAGHSGHNNKYEAAVTHYNTLQHTIDVSHAKKIKPSHCNTLQHTA